MVKLIHKKINHKIGLVLVLMGWQLSAADHSSWDYNWQETIEVNSVPMLPVAADVITAAPQQQSLSLPFPVLIGKLLVQSGEHVHSGQPIITLGGHEILSLLERIEIAEHHAIAAAKRISKNKSRFDLGDITQEVWLEWKHQAHTTELELKALQLQSGILKKWLAKATTSGLTLAAPMSGVISFPSGFIVGSEVNASEPIVAVADGQALQLEFQLPLAMKPSSVKLGDCKLGITWQSQNVQFQRRTWRSDYLDTTCLAALGQKLVVQPIITEQAFKVARNSLVQTEDSDGVIADPNKPVLVDVKVLAREGDWIYVKGDLAGRSLATSDVAALKGHLMGLGASE